MKTSLVRQIVIATLCKLLLNIGRRFVYPFAPALSRGLEVPLTAVTSIIAVSQFSSLAGIVSGPLADRLGYRFMMSSGLLLLATGMFLCGISSVYVLVMIGLVFASLGKTIFDPAIQAYIGRKVVYSKRARAIGFSETSWAGSTLVGIPLLGLSIEYFGLQASFIILACCSTLGYVILRTNFPMDEKSQEKSEGLFTILTAIRGLLRIRQACGMLLFGFWISFANDCLFVTYGVWFEHDFHVGLVSLGFSTVAIGLAELAGESFTAFFADKLGLKRALFIGLCLAIMMYILLPLIGVSLFWAMVGLFLIFTAFEFTIVTSFSLSTELVPTSRATMMAGFYAAAGLGRMIGVLVGNYMWNAGGIMGVSFSSAFLTFLGLISLTWGVKEWKHENTN